MEIPRKTMNMSNPEAQGQGMTSYQFIIVIIIMDLQAAHKLSHISMTKDLNIAEIDHHGSRPCIKITISELEDRAWQHESYEL